MRSIKEVQKLSDSKLILWLVIVGVSLPVTTMLIQIFKDPSPQTDSLIRAGFVLLVVALMFFLIFFMKTVVQINYDSLEFKTNPLSNNLKKLERQDITDFYITNHKWYHGLGYKISLSFGRIYVMKPGKVLVIKTKNGKEYRLGINRPKLVARFLADHWKVNDHQHG